MQVYFFLISLIKQVCGFRGVCTCLGHLRTKAFSLLWLRLLPGPQHLLHLAGAGEREWGPSMGGICGPGLQVAPWLPLTFHWPELNLMATLKSKESWKVGPTGVPKTKRRAWIRGLGTSGKSLSLGLIPHSIHLETICSAPTWYLALFDRRYYLSPSQWLDPVIQTKSGLFKVE